MSALQDEGSQLVLIRHAPVSEPGILCGRTDLPARIDAAEVAPVAAALSGLAEVVTSPARRCRQTAAAIWPDRADFAEDPRLWEQDFGEHDGRPFADQPDLGPMSSAALARHRAPGGESFEDLCRRVFPSLDRWSERASELGRPVVLVVHAGVIRAALARVMDCCPAGLRFEVAPLSMTRLRVGRDGPLSVIETNRVTV